MTAIEIANNWMSDRCRGVQQPQRGRRIRAEWMISNPRDKIRLPLEIAVGWLDKIENSGKEYVSLPIAALKFDPKKLYANLGRAAGRDDRDVHAVIWNPATSR